MNRGTTNYTTTHHSRLLRRRYNTLMQIDLNCDLGEGCRFDAELMPLISSANIACGAHAGDPATMTKALEEAKKCGVQVGAHPGFFDREHFGRRDLPRAPHEVFGDCVYQIAGLKALAELAGAAVTYVKPHGALYNLACRDRALARPVVEAANRFDLPVMGLPGSQLALETLEQAKRRFVAEGFADRRYRPDGSLVSRSEPDAIIDDPQEAVAQVERLIRERGVETICVHGDNPKAVAFVRRLREFLTKSGFEIKAF